MKLARDRNLLVIKDSAHAHGAIIDAQCVASFGQVGAWSFCRDKIIITGGEDGIVTTDDEDLWPSMWAYKDQGKSLDAVYNRKYDPGFRRLNENIGTS